MCRIAAYAGPPVTLSAVLYDPPHSLERQAYRPNELVHGTVNVDSTGVAWGGTTKARNRSATCPRRRPGEIPTCRPWRAACDRGC